MNAFLRAILAGTPALLAACAAAPPRPAADGLLVAVAQPRAVPGDVKGNIDRMEPLVEEASRRGARLVVFSECGITGYDLKGVGATAALDLDHPALRRIDALAARHGTVVVAGLHERREGKLHNTAVAFLPDGRRVVQRKHLIMDPEKQTAPIVPAPRERVVFEIDGFRAAILICSDAGIPGIFEEIARTGGDVVILITAGGGDASKGLHQADLVRPEVRARYAAETEKCLSKDAIEQAIRLDLAQVACNQMAWDAASGCYHGGGSSIIDRTGEVTAVIPFRLVFEHLRPQLAVGRISRKAAGRP
jgi:predicted amidohydrolase